MPTSLLPDWLAWASSILPSVWSTITSTPIIPLITVMGAVGIAVAALKQARTASDRHQEQTKADQERRITESFAKAIEQLGSDKREVRLGGIYTLERISRESAREYWPIMETLTAYVREHAQWTHLETPELENASEDSKTTEHKPTIDIQAVLTVLGRRLESARKQDETEHRRLNLANTDLRGADLWKTHLEKVILMGAHLEGVYLGKAHLERAHLMEAHLEGVILTGAHLEKVILMGAHLEGADLRGAHLEGVILTGAHLEEVYLGGVNLREAIGLTQMQLLSARGDEDTRLPEGLTRPAHWHKQKDQD